MSAYVGDFAIGATVTLEFNTQDASGAAITLAGTPVVSVYKQGNTTEVVTGVTLTVDYDSRTGNHRVIIDLSSDGTFYAAGNDFFAKLTAGTVNGISVVGKPVGHFSIQNRYFDANVKQIGGSQSAATNAANFWNGAITTGTAQAGATGSITLAAGASSVTDFYKNAVVVIVGGTGINQNRRITGYNGTSKVADISGDRNWGTTPDNTSVYMILGDIP